MLYPFIGGQKGCGGQLRSGEEAALEEGAVQTDVLAETQPQIDTAIPPSDVAQADKGPTDIICQPGIPPPKERVAPSCADFLPPGVAATMVADLTRVNKEMLDKMDWWKQLAAGVDPLGLASREVGGLDKLASICMACAIKQAPPALMGAPAGAGAEAPMTTMMAKEKERFNIDACEKFIVIYGYKGGMNVGVHSLAKDVNADADGIYQIKDYAAAESGDFLFIGSKDKEYVKAALAGPHEYELKDMALFMPATVAFGIKAEAIQSGFRTPLFDAFKVLPLPFDAFKDVAGVTFLGAIDLQKLMTVSAAIYDKDMQAQARSVLAIAYEEFKNLLDIENKESFVIADKEKIMKMKEGTFIDQSGTVMETKTIGTSGGYQATTPIYKDTGKTIGELPVDISKIHPQEIGKLVSLCGNGVKDAGELCGEPGLWPCGPGTQCKNCRECVPICGDGKYVTGEECDQSAPDGNKYCPINSSCVDCKCKRNFLQLQ